MTSKTAKRKARKRSRAITLALGMSVPQRPHPRDRSHTHQQETPMAATETALTARLRHSGTADTPEARKAASAPHMGCAVGRMIEGTDDRQDLWAAVSHIRKAAVAYDRACGAPARHAQCLRILTNGEAFDAASAPVDDRPQEDRDRSAVSAWMAVIGWLAYADAPARQACILAVVDEPDRATVRNSAGVLRALRCVSEGIKGQPVTYRW